jgi:hypothetical protein
MVSFIESGAAKAGKPLKMRDIEVNQAITIFFMNKLLDAMRYKARIY